MSETRNESAIDLAEVQRRLAVALTAHQNRPLSLVLTVPEAFVLLAHLQLALRHRASKGGASALVRGIIGDIAAGLGTLDPVFAQAIEMGDNPAFDVPLESEVEG